MTLNRMVSYGRKGLLAAAMMIAAFASGAAPSDAQDATAKQGTDILRSLMPKAGADDIGRGSTARKVRIRTPKGEHHDFVVDYRYQTDVTVYFDYDSSEITDKARRQLRALGRALASPELRPYRYMVAGHTDAKGSEDYNQELSMRRAEAVRDHLVETYGINERRLIVTGWGFSQLKQPDNPYSAANRRVEVVLVADPAYAPNAQPMSEGPVPPFVRGRVPGPAAKGGVPCVPGAGKSLDDFGKGQGRSGC